LTRKELKYLQDVIIAIEDLQKIIGEDKRFENFNNNKITRYAVERIFEIIGEAVRNFKTINKEIDISNSKQIIGLRNRIIHAYDSIDYVSLWAIVINDIPKLKIEIDELIKKHE